MAHNHFCKVCGVVTATCADACVQEEDHYCSVHHIDPRYRQVPVHVPRMNVRVVNDDEPLVKQSEK